MKDEIENILGNINFEVETEQEWLEPLGLDRNTWKQILDYITNLQKENKQLKETIKEATRILNSAKNHYGNDGKNWALERVIDLLGDKEIEEIPLFEGTLEQLNNLSILGDKEQDIELDVLKALNTDLDDDVEMG